MTIDFNIEELRKQHDCINYFETGLWDPRSNVSSRQALSCNFENVYCIEIREDWVELGKKCFENEIKTNRYHLIRDDSANMKNHMNNENFKKKTMFFLDAHVDNSNIHNFKTRCPLFYELNAIKILDKDDHIILIDDLRLINKQFPWGETKYGNINFLEAIKQIILSINKNYKFKLLNGHVKNDILCAYI